MNTQELYDKISIHLLEQGVAALEDGCGECIYLDQHSGNRCAVGFIIPNDHEAEFFMGGIVKLVGKYPDLLKTWKINRFSPEFNLLMSLQAIHDCSEPCYWRDRLTVLGVNNSLDVSKVENWKKEENK